MGRMTSKLMVYGGVRAATVWVVAGLLSVGVTGCTESGDNYGAASTPTATAEPSTTPTMTPTPEEDFHDEVAFGSNEPGSGALTVHDYDENVAIPLAGCLGGSDAECTGGTLVYIGVSPGFPSLEEDEPADSIYALDDGTPVTLEVVGIEEGLSFRYEDVVVSTAGESVLLGETPLHADIEWQLAIPAGAEHQHPHQISLRLTTTSESYTSSEDFSLFFTPSTEGDDHTHE